MEAHVSPPEVFSWLAAISSSLTPTAFHSPFRQRARRKYLPMAFSDSQVSPSSSSHFPGKASSTPTSDMQLGKRRMYCTIFFADRTCLGLLSPEQMQSPGSHVRTNASVGRLSGAVHGGNSRRRRIHKRGDTVQEEITSRELDGLHESDCHDLCDMAVGVDESSSLNSPDILLANTSVYDSIHGDFWINDPYYQEFEAAGYKAGRMDLEDTSLRSNEASVDNQGGYSTALACEYVNISGSRTDIQTTKAEAHNFVSEKTCKSSQKPLGVAEMNQHLNVGHQRNSYNQINSNDNGIRKIESAERPLVNCGSLQEIEVSNLENRFWSGNGQLDETSFERRADGKGARTAVAGTLEDWKFDMVSMAEDADMVSTPGQEEEEGKVLTDSTALEQVGQVVEQVTSCISESIKEQVASVVDQMEKLPETAEQVVMNIMDQVSEVLPDPMVEQAGQVAEQVTQKAEQLVDQVTSHVVEPISTTASQIANFLSSDEEDEESDDEFEAYTSLDIPEFKGRQGLNNFTILQEKQGLVALVYDFYIFMLKRSLFEFSLGMFAAPVLLSMVFTILYLPQFDGLALDETVRAFLQSSDQNAQGTLEGLHLSWQTVFQVFMFSVSLSTGLQPELAPLSPYTLVVANLNALFAQLIFVFLSGAVFARLSQPSQPVKCSTVAIICPPPSNRRLRKEACYKSLMTRYVLAGPQPCELVDVKVDLTYHYNTVTRSGTYFRTSQSLKLVRPEIAFLDHGMLVRHVIDETSPLYQRTQGMLAKEDAVFSLSVVGLERSSMQSVFHVEHYCVHDKDVVWDAEFVDMILISKKNRRVVDHSLLSNWRTVIPR